MFHSLLIVSLTVSIDSEQWVQTHWSYETLIYRAVPMKMNIAVFPTSQRQECYIWKAAHLTEQHIHQTNWKALWCSTTAVQIVRETTNCYVHSHLLWSKIRLHYSTFSPSLLPYVRAAFVAWAVLFVVSWRNLANTVKNKLPLFLRDMTLTLVWLAMVSDPINLFVCTFHPLLWCYCMCCRLQRVLYKDYDDEVPFSSVGRGGVPCTEAWIWKGRPRMIQSFTSKDGVRFNTL